MCLVFVAVLKSCVVAVRRGSSCTAVHKLLTALASLVEHRLSVHGLAVVANGLRYPAARGIFPDGESNPCPLHWQVDF